MNLKDNVQHLFALRRVSFARTRAFSLIFCLLTLSLLVEYYSCLSIRSSLLGVTTLALLLLSSHRPEQDCPLILSNLGLTTKVYMTLLAVISLDTPYTLQASLLVWLPYLTYDYRQLLRQGNRVQQKDQVQAVFSTILCLYQTICLMKHSSYITCSWKWLLLPFVFISLLAGFMGFVIGQRIIRYGEVGGLMFQGDDQDWSELSEKQNMRQNRAALFQYFNFYLAYNVTFLDVYIFNEVYLSILWTTVVLSLMQTLLLFTLQRRIVRFLNIDLFKYHTVIKIGQNIKFRGKLPEHHQLKGRPKPECLCCEDEARVIDLNCKRVILCTNCYRKSKNRNCPVCHKPWSCYRTRERKLQFDDRLSMKRTSMLNYIEFGQYLLESL